MVATPIGNLQDISPRAVATLQSVDLVACEDTRHTGKLLKYLGIKKKLISYHEHNEELRVDELSRILEGGQSVAIVSDAGTPGICDPSFKLVKRASELGIKVVPIPGANAVIVSGLPADSLFFGGFLPSRKNERRKRLTEVKSIPATLAFYETPHRIGRSLTDCAEILGDREASVVRELTKIHEEIVCGKLHELAERFSNGKTKGEIVLIIERQRAEIPVNDNLKLGSMTQTVKNFEDQGIDRKKALKLAAKEFGLSKPEAYKILLSEKR